MHEFPNQQATLDAARQETEQKSVLSYYSFEGYCENLYLTKEDFPGKTILDLGSGKYEEFSREATKLGATVVSVNPKLAHEGVRADVVDIPDWQEMSVAARAQQLPFADQSFDTVVSYWAIPAWVPQDTREMYESEMELILDECLRVLKPGGKIVMSPVVHHEEWDEQQILEANLGKQRYARLKENNIRIELLGVPKKNGTIILHKPAEALSENPL